MMSTFDPRRWRTLPVILLASFMASFDYMVVNVAAPALAHDLGASRAALELVVGGYGFTYASGMVTGGKLGDLFGHRRMFLLGMAAFTLASLLCGLAGTPGELVGARLVQGLAAAVMAPQVLALVSAIFPAGERPKALSWFGVTIGMGGIAGQVLGGLLLQADLFGLGWRVIFLVNVPVGLAALAAAARLVPQGLPRRRAKLDLAGAVGVSGSLGLALIPLVVGREQGWPLWSWLMLAGSVPALAATVAWERAVARRGAEPLLDLALFRGRTFAIGLLVMTVFMVSFGSLLFVTTLLLQLGLGLGSLAAGLAFLPMGAATMAASLLGRRLRPRAALTAGVAVSALGMVTMAVGLHLAGAGVVVGELLVPLAMFGFGSGLAVPALMGVVLGGVRPERAGAASGVLTTTQQFSSAIGVAALGAVFFSVLGSGTGAAAYAGAAQPAAWLGAALMLAAVGLVAALPRPKPVAAPEQGVAPRQVPVASRV